ncbi:MAG: stage V sporulation protein AD [Clostridia bacterium]|nr:stage V sporulation protein AD [Clostridia bacterium]
MGLIGRRTFLFENDVSIVSRASIAGPKEGKGPLGAAFDMVMDDDLLGQKSWEMAESEMLRRTVELCMRKAKKQTSDIGALLSGDLNAQIISSGFAARSLGVPFFGLYGACSTMAQSMIAGAALVDGGYLENAVCAASSHFCTAERQFRSPLELGCQRPPSAQWTVTAAGAVMLMKAEGEYIRVTHGTVGRVIDMKIKDANHMGAAMAPAVMDTLIAHFEDTGRDFRDYGRIITGDLGIYGRKLLIELLKDRGINADEEKLMDAGAEMFYKEQDAHAGGSGCGCVASVLAGKVLDDMEKNAYERALVLGSGAMLSLLSSQQGESIPSVSYAAALEGGSGNG